MSWSCRPGSCARPRRRTLLVLRGARPELGPRPEPTGPGAPACGAAPLPTAPVQGAGLGSEAVGGGGTGPAGSDVASSAQVGGGMPARAPFPLGLSSKRRWRGPDGLMRRREGPNRRPRVCEHGAGCHPGGRHGPWPPHHANTGGSSRGRCSRGGGAALPPMACRCVRATVNTACTVAAAAATAATAACVC